MKIREKTENTLLRDVTLCRLAEGFQRFREMYCLHRKIRPSKQRILREGKFLLGQTASYTRYSTFQSHCQNNLSHKETKSFTA
jgi:hypothetical protein